MEHSFFVEKEREHIERLEADLLRQTSMRVGFETPGRWVKKRRQALNHIHRQQEQRIVAPDVPHTGVIPLVIGAMSADELASELRVEWDGCCCYIPTGKAYDRARHIQHLLAILRRRQTMTIRGDLSSDAAHQSIQQIQKKLASLRE